MLFQYSIKPVTKLSLLGYLLFALFSFIFSLLYSKAYQLGDQVFYHAFYDSLSSAKIIEVLKLQLAFTGSSEPVYGILTWVGAQIFQDKDVFFSFINTIFILSLLHFLVRNSASPIFCMLMFLNFYVVVLLGSAERLKVSFTFLLLACLASGFTAKALYISAASITHFQTLILLLARAFGFLVKVKFSRVVRARTIVLSIFGFSLILIIMSAILFLFSNALLDKARAYSSDRGIESVRELLILTIATIFVLKRKKLEGVLSIVSLFAAAILVGPERVNIMGFILFSYFVVVERRTKHPVVLIMMLYFAIRGVIFTVNVFNNGTGF